jgi:hypothetical protein
MVRVRVGVGVRVRVRVSTLMHAVRSDEDGAADAPVAADGVGCVAACAVIG